MPLQLRRGTTSQRQSYKPLISELIYDTEQKLVYVGDGDTPGGVAIDQDSSPDLALSDLNNVVIDGLSVGEIIKYNGTNWINAELSFADLSGIELNSPEVNQVLRYNGTAWTNDVISATDLPDNFTGDLSGSVFADDSTLLVDGVSGRIVGPVFSDVRRNDNSIIINQTTGDVDSRNISAQLLTVREIITDFRIEITNISGIPNLLLKRININDNVVSPVVGGDTLGIITTSGYNGSTFVVGTRILSNVRSSALGTGMPSSLDFEVNNANNEQNVFLSINGAEDRIETTKPFEIFDDEYRSGNSVFGIWQFHNNPLVTNTNFARARGSRANREAVQDGDRISNFSFLAFNGTFYSSIASIGVVVDGEPTSSAIPGKIIFRTNNGTSGIERLTIDKNGVATVNGQLLITGIGGFGYTVGAGGAITQLDSKSTGVTLNAATGEITTHDESLNTDSAVFFVVTNSSVADTDHVVISHTKNGSLGKYNVTATPSNGSFTVTIYNVSPGTLSEAISLKFTVIKSAIS